VSRTGSRRAWSAVVLGLAAIVVAAAIAAAYLTACGASAEAPAEATAAQSSPAATAGVTVFFVGHGQLVPVGRTVSADEEVATAAVQALLYGPTEKESSETIDTVIPAGTRLLSSAVDGTIASVSLSEEFLGGRVGAPPPGEDEAEYQTRLAQIIFTVTAVSGIETVELSVAGTPVAGVTEMRLSRADFDGLSLLDAAANGGATEAGGVDPDDAGAVQQRLVELAYLPAEAVNGSYDDRTAQAVMAFQAWEGLVPDGVVGDLTAAALGVAEPPRPSQQGDGRWVEIHREVGTTLLVEDGVTVRAVHSSSGESGDEPPHATPPGSFAVTAKALKDWSEPYEVWMPYACYFNGGIAIHGADAVPPWPASHGCVRVPNVEAPVVYRFVSVGTPVFVK